MANIANNEALAVFPEGVTVKQKQAFFNDFKEWFDVYGDSEYDINDEQSNTIQLSYGSRWTEQQEKLQELSDNHKCSIYGVCYEWGCLYVNHFEIIPLIL